MAINKKQKKHWKKKKGAGRRKNQDPLSKKAWFNIRGCAPFKNTNLGMTCVNKRAGMGKRCHHHQLTPKSH